MPLMSKRKRYSDIGSIYTQYTTNTLLEDACWLIIIYYALTNNSPIHAWIVIEKLLIIFIWFIHLLQINILHHKKIIID